MPSFKHFQDILTSMGEVGAQGFFLHNDNGDALSEFLDHQQFPETLNGMLVFFFKGPAGDQCEDAVRIYFFMSFDEEPEKFGFVRMLCHYQTLGCILLGLVAVDHDGPLRDENLNAMIGQDGSFVMVGGGAEKAISFLHQRAISKNYQAIHIDRLGQENQKLGLIQVDSTLLPKRLVQSISLLIRRRVEKVD